jgi:hypothetical protein
MLAGLPRWRDSNGNGEIRSIYSQNLDQIVTPSTRTATSLSNKRRIAPSVPKIGQNHVDSY